MRNVSEEKNTGKISVSGTRIISLNVCMKRNEDEFVFSTVSSTDSDCEFLEGEHLSLFTRDTLSMVRDR